MAHLFVPDEVLLGVDIGGTNIVVAALAPDGEILSRIGGPTLPERGPEDGIQRILGFLHEAQQQSRRATIAGVGIGITGPIDRVRGRIQNPYTLPTWDDVPLADSLHDALGVPVVLENDAHAAALGEFWLGAGRGTQHMIYLTIGTGVGGGIIVNGMLHTGATGLAGEVGHMTVTAGGPECYCGSHGCIESLAAAPALAQQARDHPDLAQSRILSLAGNTLDGITAEIIASAAQVGDAVASSVIERAAHALGIGLRNLVLAISPDRIVLGGGVMRSFDLFYPVIRQTVQSLAGYLPVDQLEIVAAQLGLNAGVSGAVRALLDRAFGD